MALKIFKGAWFVSVLAVLANLLYVYASLPEEVIIQEESTGRIIAGREFLFYAMTGLILLVNSLVYVNSKLNAENMELRSWFHGLVITINIFFIFAMSLIQTYNSLEAFNFAEIGFIIYGSVGLVILWAISWPIYLIIRKIYPKQIISEQS